MNQRTQTRTTPTPPPRAWLERTDRELVALARGAGALRLGLGDGLRALRETGGYLELGFPSLGAYAFERLGRKRRWAEDTARVAGALAALPLTRAALAAGDIHWSMAELLTRQRVAERSVQPVTVAGRASGRSPVSCGARSSATDTAELLARAATPDTEADLLADAKTLTFRAMRARLAQAHAAVGAEDPAAAAPDETEQKDEDEEARRTLQVTVDRVTAWAYELTRRFVHAMHGDPSDDAVIEALLAEALVTLLTRHPELDLPDPATDACARAEAWRRQLNAWRKEAELAAETGMHGRRGPVDQDLRDAVADAIAAAVAAAAKPGPSPAPPDPAALDQHLRDLDAQLQRRDRALGERARVFWDAAGWYHLGYASPTQYAHERLGASLASLKARMTLARGCARLPEVAHALDAGDLGFEAARLVARVADRSTVDAWLDRAARRTVKHLREEVEAAESIARANGDDHGRLAPPDASTLTAYLDLERAMLDGTVAELLVHGGQLSGAASRQLSGDVASQMSGAGGGQLSGDESAPRAPLVRPGAGRVPLRLRLRDDIVHLWHDVERLFRRADEPGDFVDYLIRTFWHTWLFRDPAERVAYQHIYERERFRCASPVCSNRDLTPHHLVFRGRGGGDEDSNLLGLCVVCHLELVHQGRLAVTPPAGHGRWTLGRRPLLVVDGRERRR